MSSREVVTSVTIRDQILRDLDQLAPEQQRRAADLVRSLAVPLPASRFTSNVIDLANCLRGSVSRPPAGAWPLSPRVYGKEGGSMIYHESRPSAEGARA
jgi:hypothetical protein